MTTNDFSDFLSLFPNFVTEGHAPDRALLPCINRMDTLSAAIEVGLRAFAPNTPSLIPQMRVLKSNRVVRNESLGNSIRLWIFLYKQGAVTHGQEEARNIVVQIEAIPATQDHVSDWLFVILFRRDVFTETMIDAAQKKLIEFYRHLTRDASHTA